MVAIGAAARDLQFHVEPSLAPLMTAVRRIAHGGKMIGAAVRRLGPGHKPPFEARKEIST